MGEGGAEGQKIQRGIGVLLTHEIFIIHLVE